ncbi:MAG: hypothetical protein AAFQ65_02460 [Myxococcota bacterium]
MVDKQNAMKLLVDACPSFQKKYESYVEATYGSGQERLPYVDVGELTNHLDEMLHDGAVEELTAVFRAIEVLHLQGDEYVREFATIGVLEGIQNTAKDPAAFEPFLQEESKKWWIKLNEFWSGQTPLLK